MNKRKRKKTYRKYRDYYHRKRKEAEKGGSVPFTLFCERLAGRGVKGPRVRALPIPGSGEA